jgi:hypothetical protein
MVPSNLKEVSPLSGLDPRLKKKSDQHQGKIDSKNEDIGLKKRKAAHFYLREVDPG